MTSGTDQPWHKTACIICALNCGLECRPRAVASRRSAATTPTGLQGYVCEKSQRIDYYQNGADRLSSPMRRRPDAPTRRSTGTRRSPRCAEVQGDQGAPRRREHPVLRRANQGSHLGGTYADSTQKALGIKYRSNALAQEKTGEFWVGGKMLGAGAHRRLRALRGRGVRGKNPWHSHGFAAPAWCCARSRRTRTAA